MQDKGKDITATEIQRREDKLFADIAEAKRILDNHPSPSEDKWRKKRKKAYGRMKHV